MNPIFPIIAIFILVIILFFLSQVVIKIIWKYKEKSNSTKPIANLGIAIALLVLFVMLMLAIISAINMLTNVDTSFSNKSGKVTNTEEIAVLNIEDCQQLINEIYLGENKVYNSENHRYIEVVSTPQNIVESYQKGAKELNSVSQQYLDLNLNPESKHYSQIIANKLQEKAKLFEQRSEISTDSKNKRKINRLLDKMDLVTKERLNAIESVENQCDLKE
ncbi:hypothetical protein Xen7305DRAFT_00043120 [Xenococcus sp. PCC 7305]|uniref:hypothetical protein n=1 Tax=Xenococcus sp. PCC 7305 TaxID=102125 RepID=UPI0002ABFC70|nr:hypothetical protein [Xenococcus sp. PCC 7305]ELS04577.1 hypothetical protein Xen7305DRAFT_00043120 [Xenococcus sp. PCC 7305]